MDRSILEGDPHSVLEGMLICGYAIGAQEGYVYCRAEYPQAIQRLKIAIDQANAYGLLGENILGTNFSFQIHLKEGAGAFVCGEETALIASIEGRRGEPRPKPPYTAVSGLWGKPSNVNNVKTLANVPQIISKGADWFRQIGTKNSPGTAIFALTGKIKNTGLVEMPMGTTLGELIFRYWRRDSQWQEVQGRADRRPAGRLSARRSLERAGGLRLSSGGRRHHGFRRNDRGG